MVAAPTHLRADGRVEPLGIGSTAPEFAWAVSPDTVQDYFQLEVAPDSAFETVLMWRSDTVADSKPFGVTYRGDALSSRTRYWWRVRTGSDGVWSEWSAPSWFETGLLRADTISGHWVSAPYEGPDDRRALYFRRPVAISQPVARARVRERARLVSTVHQSHGRDRSGTCSGVDTFR